MDNSIPMNSIILMPMLMPIMMGAVMTYAYMPVVVAELKKQNERLAVIIEHLDNVKRSSN